MKRSLAALALLLSACADEPPPAPQRAPARQLEAEPGVLRLMGSGAMAPYAAILAQRWNETQRELRLVLEPSVGSGGGIRAAADGAIDVGLSARPLSAEELGFGLKVLPAVKDRVVFAANLGFGADRVSIADLEALYAGRATTLSGIQAVLLLRDAQESANAMIESSFPQLRALREEAYRSHRLRVLYHDDAMGEALINTPGALGVYNRGTITARGLPLKVLEVNGLDEGIETLSFVLRADRLDRARPFLDFSRSTEAQALAAAAGYLPLETP